MDLPGRSYRVFAVAVILMVVLQARNLAADEAAEIFEATGIQGGLIVHLGCGDGELTAALRVDDGYLVHGLDRDPGNVARARAHIQSLGSYGQVSINLLAGSDLPYVDNLVNLLVTDDLGDVPTDEVLRVLAPRGVAYIKSGDTWTKTVKPWPQEIDEWTHHLHNPGGNAVARDRVVGPPRHLQWTDGPLWARSHGWTPSVSAMVSAGGRLFYIGDETLTCVDATVKSKWFLVARDAFSGVQLWKCPVSDWGSRAISGTPDTGGNSVVGRFTMPPHVGKRLVAVGDKVYATLGASAPVSELDAATGRTLQVFQDTARADEILCMGGRLVVSVNPDKHPGDALPEKHVCAVDVNTGRTLWKKGPFAAVRATRTQDPHGRLELAAGDGQVFLLTRDTIESLAEDTGETLWTIDRPALPEDAVRRMGFAGMYEYQLTVMVYRDGVVLLAQPEPNTHHTYHTMPGTLYAFHAKTGEPIWKHAYGGWGHCTPPDVFVVDDVVWTHVDAKTEFGSVWGSGFRAKDSSTVDYRIQALDLKTGELKQEFPTKDLFNVGHHHRCYRNKITERFLMASRRGVEFVDLTTGENTQNHWVRSGCLLGNLPCNGLLYVTPHPCSCYLEAKLTGFNALAADRSAKCKGQRAKHEPVRAALPNGGQRAKRDGRIERGSAFGDEGLRPLPVALRTSSWPTYRGDGTRSGATQAAVSQKLKLAWRSDIGARPSAPVVAGGRLLVAGADAHTVYAIDTESGERVWQYTVGARVDSPPTIHQRQALFGSADGHVYCLRVSDGALIWRFAAAPNRQLLSAFGQLESPWPVPGSVLIHEGLCWFAAGRSSYLDGGIRVFALEPATGRVVHEHTIYSPDPKTGKMAPAPSANAVAGLLNDIPGSNGTHVFLRQMQVSSGADGAGPHLYSSGGFLDASWFNRTYWKYGKAQTSGLMVLGDGVAFGAEVFESRSRETVFKPGGNAYRLRCLALKTTPQAVDPATQPKRKRRGGRPTGPPVVWEQHVPIRVTAMLRAADTIFVAGSPDRVDPQDPHAAWEGRAGGVSAAYAAADGTKLAEYEMPAPPAWDGAAAANGRLCLSLVDGTIACYK